MVQLLASATWRLASLVAQSVKSLPANAGDPGSIPGWVRFPGDGNGSPLQYFCLENSMDRGAWWATVHGVTKRYNECRHEIKVSCRETCNCGEKKTEKGTESYVSIVLSIRSETR